MLGLVDAAGWLNFGIDIGWLGLGLGVVTVRTGLDCWDWYRFVYSITFWVIFLQDIPTQFWELLNCKAFVLPKGCYTKK